MERILNDNEKIRKAEEIYYRRNHRNVSINTRDAVPAKTYLGSKIMLEMLILLLLATAVFAIKNKDYIFTQTFLNSLANYNVNLTEKFNSVKSFFVDSEVSNEVFVNSNVDNNTQNMNQQENVNSEQVQNQEAQMQEQTQNSVIQEQGQEVNKQAQEQIIVTDSVSLRNSYNFVKPLDNGIVSSGFGARESVYQNVRGEHKGIDIAADLGTKIKASMAGTVTQVSSEGDYGNHIRITKNNVTTLYAHCNEIYVVEGQEIIEGQEIASVGSTGNSTGPHLHFEIRIDDNYINPAEIIQF